MGAEEGVESQDNVDMNHTMRQNSTSKNSDSISSKRIVIIDKPQSKFKQQ